MSPQQEQKTSALSHGSDQVPTCENADRAAMQKAAFEAFSRELPQLLKDHPGKWVAYHGTERLGVADDDIVLYEMGRRHGLSPVEMLVIGIDPEADQVPLIHEPEFLALEGAGTEEDRR
jgi:hypothetical protein